MTFFQYYKELEGLVSKRNFRKEIINRTKIEPGTFYTWLQRKKIPLLAQGVISEYMKTSQTELFPENSINKQSHDI